MPYYYNTMGCAQLVFGSNKKFTTVVEVVTKKRTVLHSIYTNFGVQCICNNYTKLPLFQVIKFGPHTTGICKLCVRTVEFLLPT